MEKSDFDLNYQNENIESKIVASLERISQAFRVLLWQESKEVGLSPIQIQILIFILNHSDDKCLISYLADEFNMTKATVSDSVKVLEKKELITKEFNQLDSRSFHIKLTHKGKLIAEQNGIFTKQIRKPISSMSDREKEQLLISLLSIISNLNNQGIITIQRMCSTCRFHNFNKNNNKHFCNLLNKELQLKELRVDCPEHESLK